MIVLAQAGRDLRIAFRSRGETAHPVAFFALAVTLFGLGLGSDLKTLGAVAVVVVWVIALLACMLATEGLFRRDFEDGTLEQMLLHGRPIFLAVLGKLAAHWCVSGLPLVLFAPVAGFMLQAPAQALPMLVLSLAIGTPTLTAIGAVAAALTAGLGRGGLLVALIALPLYVPVLIFGAGASVVAASGESALPQLLWLLAMLAAAATFAPFAVGFSLRLSQEY